MIVNPRILSGVRHRIRPGPEPMSAIWPLASIMFGLIVALLLIVFGDYVFPVG